MNTAQRIVLALGTIVITVMALFPSWFFVFSHPECPRVEQFADVPNELLYLSAIPYETRQSL